MIKLFITYIYAFTIKNFISKIIKDNIIKLIVNLLYSIFTNNLVMIKKYRRYTSSYIQDNYHQSKNYK